MLNMDFFGPGARFHHAGIVVKSIEEAFLNVEKTNDPIQKVSVAFFSLNGLNIELIEPADENSPVNDSLKKGMKLLHLCYSVPDLKKALAKARKHGLHKVSSPSPAAAFDNKNIIWVYSNTYGLFELIEEPDKTVEL